MEIRRRTCSASWVRSRRWTLALAAIGCFGPISHAFASAFGFGDPFSVHGGPVGERPVVAVGDLDADGRNDVVASRGDHTVWVHMQSASGRLEAPQSYRVPTGSVYSLRVLDIDGYGSADLLVGHQNGLSVRISSGEWRHVSAIVPCGHMDAADIDLDGWLDVACLGTNGYVTLYFNDGRGQFRDPVYMWTPAFFGTLGNPNGLKLRDVTGDGYPDLVVIATFTSGFYIHPHNGKNGFLPAYGYPHASLDYVLSPSGIAVIDVDADGIEEIITTSSCNNTCASLHVHRRDTLGFFRHVEDIPTFENPTSLMSDDLNGDGYVDMLVRHGGWATVSRYMGSAEGLSRNPVRSPVWFESRGPEAFSLGDVSGDGCVDMVFGTTVGLSVSFGRCIAPPSDFNRDGISDVLWRNVATGENMIWLAGADKSWGINGPLATQPTRAVTDIAWYVAGQGDFDGDGRSDILWRHGINGANVIWKSADADRQMRVTGVTDIRWQVVGVGDFDGDRRSDILWRHSASGANVIWKGGRYDAQLPVVGVSDLRWQVAGVSDFDGDGMADILWRHATSGANVVWKSGKRNEQQSVTGVTDTRWQVVGLGDFDGDQRADILWRHAGSGRNVIWKGADIRAQQTVATVSDGAWQVAAVADYDGDGRSDLLWRNATTGTNVIWMHADDRMQVPVSRLQGGGWGVAMP